MGSRQLKNDGELSNGPLEWRKFWKVSDMEHGHWTLAKMRNVKAWFR